MDRAEAERTFTPAALEAVAAFPIQSAEVSLVSVGENITFRVTDARDGAAYVLRLHRPGYNSLAELKSERVWVRALRDAGVEAPVAVATRGGTEFVSVAIPGRAERRHVGVTRWTDGELMADRLKRTGDSAPFEHSFRQLGGIAAAIHNQSSAWRPPPGFQRHALDADGLMGEAPFWGRFWEHPALSPGERDVLLAARARIAPALMRLGKAPSTYGLIHADLHPGNVLVGGQTLTVIDFDDAALGWHAYEIAVALLHYQDDSRFPAIQAAFLAGYRERRTLTAANEALIPMFLLIRQMALLGWLHQRPEIEPGERLAALKADACAKAAVFEAPC